MKLYISATSILSAGTDSIPFLIFIKTIGMTIRAEASIGTMFLEKIKSITIMTEATGVAFITSMAGEITTPNSFIVFESTASNTPIIIPAESPANI